MRFAPYTKEIDHILVIKCLFENSQNSKITIFGRFFTENCFRWVEFQENPNFHSFILLPSGDHRTTYDGHIRLENNLWGHLNTRGSSRDLPWATPEYELRADLRWSFQSFSYLLPRSRISKKSNFSAPLPPALSSPPGVAQGGSILLSRVFKFPYQCFPSLMWSSHVVRWSPEGSKLKLWKVGFSWNSTQRKFFLSKNLSKSVFFESCEFSNKHLITSMWSISFV